MTPEQLNRITASVHAELADATDKLAAAYARVLRGAGRKMARRVRTYSHALTAAAVHPNEDEVIPPELKDQVDRLTRQERNELVKMLVAAYEAHDVAWDVKPSVTQELLDKVGAHATFAAEQDLRQVYRDVIANAADQGLSIPNTASEIVNAVDGIAEYRATALARTDLIGLANGAGQQIATDAFAGRNDVTKIWLATDDERTRETHVEANGQEVPLNEFFDVGGFPAMYPGDPDLPDEEVINCRCTQIYSGGSGGEEPPPEDVTASAIRSDAYASGMDENGVTAAVTITVEDGAPDTSTERQRTPWEGILAIEGSPTSDGRYLIPGEIGARDLPLPIAASHEDQRATETVGRIEDIQHIPASEFDKPGWELPADLPEQAVVIWGTGTFDGSPQAEDAMRQMENGVGVSLDLPMERQALIDAQTYEEVDPAEVVDESNVLDVLFGGVPEGYLRGIAGKIGGASLASIAAFEETVIRIAENGTDAIVASGYAIQRTERFDTVALMASAAPLLPPRSWFFRDEPDEPTPITITPSGEVYGHLALWNVCHAGRANGAYAQCMYAPHSPSDYSQFHLGAMLCDDGSEVPVGRITIGTDHAPLNMSAAAARKHYDNTGTVVAFARAKDGVFGIWLSGVIKSDATPEQIRDFRACPPSGDWRNNNGVLELQAALAVNVAGFPVPRGQLALRASADELSLNTLILGPPDSDDFAEALRAEYALTASSDIDWLVELEDEMSGEFCGMELAAVGYVSFRTYTAAERRAMAKNGQALPDGSFPIANCSDAENAIRAQGRAGSGQGRAVSHIRKRVGALGCSGPIFDPYK